MEFALIGIDEKAYYCINDVDGWIRTYCCETESLVPSMLASSRRTTRISHNFQGVGSWKWTCTIRGSRLPNCSLRNEARKSIDLSEKVSFVMLKLTCHAESTHTRGRVLATFLWDMSPLHFLVCKIAATLYLWGVLRISSDGDDRRMFLGLKFSIPGFFWVAWSK